MRRHDFFYCNIMKQLFYKDVSRKTYGTRKNDIKSILKKVEMKEKQSIKQMN